MSEELKKAKPLKKKTAKKATARKKPAKRSHHKIVVRGNIKDKVDRDLLHEYLWKRSESRSHKVMIQQTLLAENLGITPFTMTRIFSEMLVSGRLKRARGVYYVVDPSVWRWKNTPEIQWVQDE